MTFDSSFPWVVGGIILLMLSKCGFRVWGLSPMDRSRLSSHSEWESLLPFATMYVISGSIFLYAMLTCMVKMVLFLVKLNSRAKVQLEKWERSGKNLRMCVKCLICAGILTLTWSRWNIKVLLCLKSIQQRDHENWWRYRAQIQVFPRFSRAWWHAMVEVNCELLSVTIYVTLLTMGLLVVKEVALPTLTCIEKWIRFGLCRGIMRSTSPQHLELHNAELLSDFKQQLDDFRKMKREAEGEADIVSTSRPMRARKGGKRGFSSAKDSKPNMNTFGESSTSKMDLDKGINLSSREGDKDEVWTNGGLEMRERHEIACGQFLKMTPAEVEFFRENRNNGRNDFIVTDEDS